MQQIPGMLFVLLITLGSLGDGKQIDIL